MRVSSRSWGSQEGGALEFTEDKFLLRSAWVALVSLRSSSRVQLVGQARQHFEDWHPPFLADCAFMFCARALFELQKNVFFCVDVSETVFPMFFCWASFHLRTSGARVVSMARHVCDMVLESVHQRRRHALLGQSSSAEVGNNEIAAKSASIVGDTQFEVVLTWS